MYTIKGLANRLRLPHEKVLKDIAMRHRRKLFCKFDEVWYQFNAVKDIIIPYSIAQNYARTMKRDVDLSLNFDNVDVDLDKPQIPIAVLLGHFNHGKTTLLDSLGNTNLVDKEVLGITQVVRSRMLSIEGRKTTMVDTPGQEIFYRMRNYGACVANFALLLVAADDGIQLQTQEAIGIIESLKIPVITCINKIDLPTVTPNKIAALKEELREFVALENAPCVEISAKNKIFGQLTAEMVKLIADFEKKRDLPAEGQRILRKSKQTKLPGLAASGTLVNLWKNAQEGLVIHVVVQNGEVAAGDMFSSGGWSGVVKRISHDNQDIKAAPGGYAVKMTIVLSKDAGEPKPIGDRILFYHAASQREVLAMKQSAEMMMEQAQMELRLGNHVVSDHNVKFHRLEEHEAYLRKKRPPREDRPIVEEEEEGEGEDEDEAIAAEKEEPHEEPEDKRIKIVLKTDSEITMGTVMDTYDDVVEAFQAKQEGQAPMRIVHSGTGDVTQQDVMMAKAADGIIVTYGVGVHFNAGRQIQNQDVRMCGFDSIQEIIDAITYKNDKISTWFEGKKKARMPAPKRRDRSGD